MYRIQRRFRWRPDGCPSSTFRGSTGRVSFYAFVSEQPVKAVRWWPGSRSFTGYVLGVYYLTMHKLADYKDKKGAVAVSDKIYNDIDELKKLTTPDPKTGKSELGLYDLIWFEDTTDNNRRVLCKPMDLFGYHFGSMNQALLAYENGEITLHQNIYVYRKATLEDGTEVAGFVYTTLGL